MVIGDLEALAKQMIGKPVMTGQFIIGRVISAVVDGEYIAWEAEKADED